MISQLEVYKIQNSHLILGGEGTEAIEDEPKVK